jgi:hypothetical protein
MRLRQHDAAEAGILHEAVQPLVTPHHHMSNGVDPQPRRLALADAAIEQVDLLRHLREQGIERVAKNLQARHLGVAQIDHDPGAVGGLDARLAQCVAQPDRTTFTAGAAAAVLRL